MTEVSFDGSRSGHHADGDDDDDAGGTRTGEISGLRARARDPGNKSLVSKVAGPRSVRERAPERPRRTTASRKAPVESDEGEPRGREGRPGPRCPKRSDQGMFGSRKKRKLTSFWFVDV